MNVYERASVCWCETVYWSHQKFWFHRTKCKYSITDCNSQLTKKFSSFAYVKYAIYKLNVEACLFVTELLRWLYRNCHLRHRISNQLFWLLPKLLLIILFSKINVNRFPSTWNLFSVSFDVHGKLSVSLFTGRFELLIFNFDYLNYD